MSEKKDDKGGGGGGVATAWGIGLLLLVLYYTGFLDGILNWIRGVLFTANMYMGVVLVIVGLVLWLNRPKKPDDHAPH